MNDPEPVATLHKHREFPQISVKMVATYPFRTIHFQTSISLGFSLNLSADSVLGAGDILTQHASTRDVLLE